MKNIFGGTKVSKPKKDNSKISKMMGDLAESYKGQASGDKLKAQATNGMGSKNMSKGLSMPTLKKKPSKKSSFKGFKI